MTSAIGREPVPRPANAPPAPPTIAPNSAVTTTMPPGGRGHASLTLKREQFFALTGTPTRFGIRVVRGSNLTTATLTSWTCHFQVVVTTKAE